MAHEIQKDDALFYSGEVPWHRMGKFMGAEPISIEEARKDPVLNWRVVKAPISAKYTSADGKPMAAKSTDFQAIIREDNAKVLAVVTDDYKPVQNSEMWDFAEALTKASGDFRIHTAGSLKGNRLVWICGELKNATFEVIKGDVLKNYLMIASSHDRSLAFTAGHTGVRVVCANTLTAAMGEQKEDNSFRFKHTGDLKAKVEEAQKVLGLLVGRAEKYQEFAKWLAGQKVSTAYTKDYIDYMMPLPEDPKEEVPKSLHERRNQLLISCMAGRGSDLVPGVTGTRWGLLNAATEYTTHHQRTQDRSASGGSSADETRTWRAWFAEGKRFERDAAMFLSDNAKAKRVAVEEEEDESVSV